MTHDLSINRRRFLQAAAAAGATLSTGLRPTLQADEPTRADPFAGFRLGAQSYTFREFNTEQALKRLKELGLHWAELYQKHAPLQSNEVQRRALLKLCKEYDVTPRAYGVQHFSKNTDENRKVFEFGKALGIKMFSADPEPDSFDSLDKLCEEYKIAIGIHPHGPIGPQRLHRWYSAEIILAAVKDHHSLIGSCLDTGHLIRSAQLGKKLDPVQQVRVMGKRNFGMHLKDHDNEKKTDVILGKAHLDMPALLRVLRDVGFDGMLSIEYEANPQDPTRDVAACVEVCKEAAQRLS
jgi:sugar phosphate isomerase/epimerase